MSPIFSGSAAHARRGQPAAAVAAARIASSSRRVNTIGCFMAILPSGRYATPSAAILAQDAAGG